MKCPELPLSADTVSRRVGDTSGDIEFSLRGRNITTKNSLQMNKSADSRGDVTSSSIVIPPPLTSLSAMNSNYEPQAMKGRVADEYLAYNTLRGIVPLSVNWGADSRQRDGGSTAELQEVSPVSGIWPVP